MKLNRWLLGLTVILSFGISNAKAGIINQWDIDFRSLDQAGKFQEATGGQNNGTLSTWTCCSDFGVLSLSEDAWFYVDLTDAIGLASLSLDEQYSDILLSFDFRAFGNPEIGGIQVSNSTKEWQPGAFNLFGTQNWGFSDFVYNNNNKWQHFEFNLDQFVSGSFSKITFINDCDSNQGCDSNVRFRNMTLTQVPEPAPLALLGFGLLGLGIMRKRKA